MNSQVPEPREAIDEPLTLCEIPTPNLGMQLVPITFGNLSETPVAGAKLMTDSTGDVPKLLVFLLDGSVRYEGPMIRLLSAWPPCATNGMMGLPIGQSPAVSLFDSEVKVGAENYEAGLPQYAVCVEEVRHDQRRDLAVGRGELELQLVLTNVVDSTPSLQMDGANRGAFETVWTHSDQLLIDYRSAAPETVIPAVVFAKFHRCVQA